MVIIYVAKEGLIDELKNHVSKPRTKVCVRHMYNNFKAYWSGKALKDASWATAGLILRQILIKQYTL